MRIVIAIGIILGAVFIYSAIQEVANRHNWRQ